MCCMVKQWNPVLRPTMYRLQSMYTTQGLGYNFLVLCLVMSYYALGSPHFFPTLERYSMSVKLRYRFSWSLLNIAFASPSSSKGLQIKIWPCCVLLRILRTRVVTNMSRCVPSRERVKVFELRKSEQSAL